jgi:hypothetical protein
LAKLSFAFYDSLGKGCQVYEWQQMSFQFAAEIFSTDFIVHNFETVILNYLRLGLFPDFGAFKKFKHSSKPLSTIHFLE